VVFLKREVNCDSVGFCGVGCKIVAVIVVVLLAGIFGAVAFNAGSVSNNLADQKVMSVSGSVTKLVAPDKVDIVLSVETLDKSAQLSQSSNAIVADRVKSTLEAFSSFRAEVKTLSYSVNEEFQWNDLTKKSESIGYRTVNQIQVTLNGSDISRAGTVIDAAVQAGANRVSSIVFSLSKEKELELRTIALREASGVAFAKATSIASGLNVSLGKVKQVNESGFYYAPNYVNSEMLKSADSGSSPTPITAGDVEVSASVSVSYEIE
jgi:uncharacterized protein YggE